MTPQTQMQSHADGIKPRGLTVSGETVVGYAIFGCLAAGTIGLCKAVSSDGVGAAWCLLASVAAFGAVCYIYYSKH